MSAIVSAVPPSPLRVANDAYAAAEEEVIAAVAAASMGRKQVALRAASEPLSDQEKDALRKAVAAAGDAVLKIYVLDNHELEMNQRGVVRVRGQATILAPDVPIGSADHLFSERGPGCVLVARCSNVSDNMAELAAAGRSLAEAVPVHSDHPYGLVEQSETTTETMRVDPTGYKWKDFSAWQAELGAHGHFVGL
jgi:hypothetical protein